RQPRAARVLRAWASHGRLEAAPEADDGRLPSFGDRTGEALTARSHVSASLSRLHVRISDGGAHRAHRAAGRLAVRELWPRQRIRIQTTRSAGRSFSTRPGYVVERSRESHAHRRVLHACARPERPDAAQGNVA